MISRNVPVNVYVCMCISYMLRLYICTYYIHMYIYIHVNVRIHITNTKRVCIVCTHVHPYVHVQYMYMCIYYPYCTLQTFGPHRGPKLTMINRISIYIYIPTSSFHPTGVSVLFPGSKNITKR